MDFRFGEFMLGLSIGLMMMLLLSGFIAQRNENNVNKRAIEMSKATYISGNIVYTDSTVDYILYGKTR